MSKIELRLLGSFSVTIDGALRDEFRSDKVRVLLAYLALEGAQPVRRSQLLKFLWFTYPHTSAQTSLRAALTNLRQLLAPLDLLTTTRQTVQLHVQQPDFWCDALELEALLTAAPTPPTLAEIEKLNQYPLLPGFEHMDNALFHAWVQTKRETYAQQIHRLRTQLPATHPGLISNDLANVPHSTSFYGRQREIVQITQWLTTERCRLVGIFGMGGQGKTVLVSQVVRALMIQDAGGQQSGMETYNPTAPFARVLWRSLLNAPPLVEILQSWVQLLSGQVMPPLPDSLDEQLALLFTYLRQQRCLLVLDNLESILQNNTRAGRYRPGFEGYGQLLRQIGESDHQSCLLLTSREKPLELTRWEASNASVRTLTLGGLPSNISQQLLRMRNLSASDAVMDTLIRCYSGNPLALLLIAQTINDLFAGDIVAFLADETLVFDDIRDVLDQHFARLTALERDIMSWLAIEREPITFNALYDLLIHPPPRWTALEAVRSLQRRSLIEQGDEYFGLQNVIIEYITDQLVDRVCHELWALKEQSKHGITGGEEAAHGLPSAGLEVRPITEFSLNRYALVKAQAKEYVRQSQVRIVLAPVATWLTKHLGAAAVAAQFAPFLQRLQAEMPLTPGYAATNLLHLLLYLNIDVRGYDFSRLTLWQADLRAGNLSEVNFTEADLANSVFLEPFETILSLTFTPDGQHLVTGAYNGNIVCWRLTDRQPVTIFKGNMSLVYSVALSSDGTTLASGSSDKTIRLWDFTTGELRHTVRGHSGQVYMVAFNPTGEFLTSISDDATARVWDIHPHGHTFARPLPKAMLPKLEWPAAIRSDGLVLVSRGGLNTVVCWDMQTSQSYATLEGHTAYIASLAISPDGKILASASYDQTIRVWEFESESGAPQLRHVLQGSAAEFLILAFSPGGKILAGAMDGVISVWDMATGQLHYRLMGHTAAIRALAFSPDGRMLASASHDQTVRLWDVHSGQTNSILHGYAYWIDLVQYSPDGTTLASSHLDSTVHVWVLPGQRHHILRGHKDRAIVLAYSPDGDVLATGSHDTTVRLWDVRTGEHRCTLPGHTEMVRTLAFHPNGWLLATGGNDYTVQLWDSRTGEQLAILREHTQDIRFLAFSPDGTLLATASKDQTIGLYQVHTKEMGASGPCLLRQTLRGHTNTVVQLAFHPDGALLASCGDGVRLWDMATGQLWETLQEDTLGVYTIAFSPDGAWLISICSDDKIRIWKMHGADRRCQLRLTLDEPTVKPAHVAFSPDSTTLAARGADLVVRLWDVHTGQVRQVLQGHTSPITAVSYSPDGRYLSSSSSDGSIRVWDVAAGRSVQTLRSEGPYAGMNITSITGITEAQKAALKALGAVDSTIPKVEEANLLHITLLGSPQILRAGQPVAGFITSKAQALFYYLVVIAAQGQTPPTRDTLVSLFWRDVPNAKARKNLRDILPNLRQLMGSHLRITNQTVAFDPSAPYLLDVQQFRTQLEMAGPPASFAALQQVLTLYQGEFLAGFYVRDAPAFEEWVLQQRSQLHLLALQGWQQLIDAALRQNDYAAGLAASERLLALEPWQEEVHVQRMHLFMTNGHRGAALMQYQTCRQVLADELGVEPSPATTALYKRLRAGEETSAAVKPLSG